MAGAGDGMAPFIVVGGVPGICGDTVVGPTVACDGD